MVNNEVTKLQNEKDLKFYRFIIAMVFVVAVVIAFVVGIINLNTYENQGVVTNAIVDVLMPKHIEDTNAESETYGMTFYREKNKSYDIDKDEPINAFSYYILNSENEKVYLENGNYYPPEYYMEGHDDVQPIAVYFGFYAKVMQKLQIVKNVLTVIAFIVALGMLAGFIYIWYQSWLRREALREAREKEFNKRFNKKQ